MNRQEVRRQRLMRAFFASSMLNANLRENRLI